MIVGEPGPELLYSGCRCIACMGLRGELDDPVGDADFRRRRADYNNRLWLDDESAPWKEPVGELPFPMWILWALGLFAAVLLVLIVWFIAHPGAWR